MGSRPSSQSLLRSRDSRQSGSAQTIRPEDESNINSSSPVQLQKYIGLKVHDKILCQDHFVSKFTGETMCRWREASVARIISESIVRIHFEGWADKHDIQIDLSTEWNRISLQEIMTEQQILDGTALDVSQEETVFSYLMTGNLPYPTDDDSGDDGTGEEFHVGQRVNVQDIFRSKQTKNILTKWRIAEIININGPMIRIHYVDWDSQWDETIDLRTEGHRIRVDGDENISNSSHSPNRRNSKSRARLTRSFNAYEREGEGEGERDEQAIRRNTTPDLVRIAERDFQTRMQTKGLQVIEVQADGNCLFRAVSHQLYLDESQHAELRQKCVDHMSSNRERFAVFCSVDFDEYLKEISLLGTWADDMEIKALEEILDRVIRIYSAESIELVPLNTNFDEELLLRDIPPIILSYHGKNHYNSVRNINQTLPLGERHSRIILNARLKELCKNT